MVARIEGSVMKIKRSTARIEGATMTIEVSQVKTEDRVRTEILTVAGGSTSED
jgi:hypothetical protein